MQYIYKSSFTHVHIYWSGLPYNYRTCFDELMTHSKKGHNRYQNTIHIHDSSGNSENNYNITTPLPNDIINIYRIELLVSKYIK